MSSATAPGKAVLSGEYAVLADAAAISAAVNRRARVTVTRSDDDCHHISAPGYLSGPWTFARGRDGSFAWRGESPAKAAFSLVEKTWQCFGDVEWPPLSIEVDTRELRDAATGLKLGLGSSAAVAVALAAALAKIRAADCDCRALAFAAHERFQDGRGSGVDVATSHDGGLILYRRAGRKSRRLGWPQGLRYRFLWSGQAAATAAKLANLAARGAVGDAFALLADRAESVAAAWLLGKPASILQAYPAYIDAMRRVSEDCDLGIFAAGHGELARLAGECGVVYKPCGAGGGDIGIVLGTCEHEVDEFCERARELKFRFLDLAIDEQGVVFAE